MFGPKTSTTAEAVMRSDEKDTPQIVIEASDQSSSSGDPTTTHHTDDRRSTKSDERFTKQETKAVNRSKVLVYVALALAAAAVGALTYYFTSREEAQDFQDSFYAFVDEIQDVSASNARSIFGQLHSLSTTMTSYALAAELLWPNVTLPHFDLRVGEAEELSGIELILFAPIVKHDMLAAWEAYAWENQGWIAEDLALRSWQTVHPGDIVPRVYPFDEDELAQHRHVDHGDEVAHRSLQGNYSTDIHVPLWQFGPVPTNASIINLDLYTHPAFERMVNDVLEVEHKLLSEAVDLNFLLEYTQLVHADDGHPRSFILQPVFDGFMEDSNVTGFLIGELAWETFFVDVLPTGTPPLLVDIKGTCGSEFTYMIKGHEARFFGEGDLHDPRYDHMKKTYEFAEFARFDGDDDDLGGVHCEYTMSIFPTAELEASYHTNQPAIFTTVVVLVFCCTAMVFALYDYMVYRRQQKLLATAKRTTAIVSSLFPKDVQDRIMKDAEEQAEEEARNKRKGFGVAPKNQLKEFLDEDETRTPHAAANVFKTKPIADLFPQVTIMFADIVGFTAWSSMREPAQVFMLLESIFAEFDMIAKRRRVFKVETVGDCYVAVAGLPEPRKDHATVMARFARDCMMKFLTLTKHLEVTLGPDTTELGMRFGLHSGPVTAGVLRGERARFQLFGDSMNTTARIETTGAKNKIHISQETADLLTAAGKGHWLRPREDKVVAKGKGELTTFWLELRGDSAKSSRSAGSSSSGNSSVDDYEVPRPDVKKLAQEQAKEAVPQIDSVMSISDKSMRLVNWNTEILSRVLREMVARREALGTQPDPSSKLRQMELEQLQLGDIVLEEVQDTIHLPRFDAEAAKKQKEASSVDLGTTVVNQLNDYVKTIAAMYRRNSFHNYEHASHVTMSVVKLLSRIVAPDIKAESKKDIARDIHDHTYGITSDPLTQFAVILSALIHDVDHTGVPNTQLIKEQASIAAVYKNKSVAEQNSVDIAWELLMQEAFADLRRVIYTNADEFKRFRQLVVNAVMATDIMDKELSQARKARWNKAFAEGSTDGFSEDDVVNRKATIVIEHLIQASDVAHTMQHWHIYRKWNARLFEEMYKAYQQGRSETDPSTNWYEGEIGFFDYYIIPLAMKLRSCGVFGVSSDEYLNYAQQNRREWECKGREIVAEMVQSIALERNEKAGNAATQQQKLATVPEKSSVAGLP